MKLFWIDKYALFSYEQLLEDVNKSECYYPLYKSDDYYKYFLNVILALSYNQNLTLIDSDLGDAEIGGVEMGDINKPMLLSGRIDFPSFSDILSALRHSIAKITIFTSGTTGQPKQVTHSINTLTRAVRVADGYSEQVWAFAYNPTHMAGLQVFFQALENQNTLVNVFNADKSFVYDAIDKYGITNISATPTFYRLLQPCNRTFLQVTRVTLGGEKSDNKLCEIIKSMFPQAKINNIYASTEAGSLFAAKGEFFQIPREIIDKIKVVADELLIHKSLLGQSDAFQFDEGYYHSGDLIEWVDEEKGVFRFASRKNELINIGGYKVNPNEVENVIANIEGVQQVMVYGKPNSVLGNVLCADVKRIEDSTILEQDIREYLTGKLQDFKIPRRIRFVDSFMLTRTGKIKRL